MPDRTGVLYADTSALVKLAVREAETDALREELELWQDVATSVITEIELRRAVARARSAGAETIDDIGVLAITWAATEIDLPEDIRQAAAILEPVNMRSLDCIHIASALSLADDLAALLTYDRRMQDAAAAHGLALLVPS